MVFYFVLIYFIRCSLDKIEEMFKELEDSDVPVSRDGELYRYFSSCNIKFSWDKDDKELKLSCNTIYPVVPEELYKLKKLEKLDLSKNLLENLPDSFAGFINLLKVDLSKNLLTEIPFSILKMEKLKHLDLSFNRITKIPDIMAKLNNLHTLLLSNNFIENIGYVFKNCTSIKRLNLGGNKKICRHGSDNPRINQEISLFSKFPRELEHLNLSKTKLYFIPESLDFPNLFYLNLSNNSLKNFEIIFENLEHIRIINLDNNEISIFPPQIYKLQKLEILSICGNLITELIFTKIPCINLKLLKLDDNPLKKLVLHNNGIYTLSTLSLGHTQLKSFVIENKNILHHIHKLMVGIPLISMKIKQLMICFESLDYIGDIFDLHELIHLSITCINKENQSPQHQLLSGLSNLKNLTILSMENCGLKIFPKSLIKLQNLKMLDLSDNLITVIPSFIKDLSIEGILLERNHISTIAVEIFHNSHLKCLGLRSNRIHILPINIPKHHNFTGVVDMSDNPIMQFGNEYFSGIFDIPYTMIENIMLELKQITVEPLKVIREVDILIGKSWYIWKENGILDLNPQGIKEHILDWDGIKSIFDMLKDKISDINLQDSTLTYLKKVYQIEEHQNDISVMYGEPQRKTLKNYIEEILKLLVTFLEKEDNNMIENCFILLENAHNVCFDGQLEHLIEIHKILTGRDLNCLKTTICNILVRYKYEGLKLITTSNSYSENVHILSFWRNFFSEVFGLERTYNLYSVNIPNILLSSGTYILIQFVKYLNVNKIVEELKNEINENPNLISEVTGFLFQLFEENFEKLKIMVTYNGEIEDLLFTGVTNEGVEAILLEYDLIE